jgi:electron transport complex protein RnfD
MPAGIGYQMAFFGSALTIGIKHIFGGKDNYIFNPTAAAFVFLILCYPGQMLLFPKPLERLPVWGTVNPTALSGLASTESVRAFDILMGNIVGAIGTVHILVIVVSGVCLLFRRSVSSTVTITALASNLLFSGVIGNEAGIFRASLTVLVSGYFLFILVFMANDPQTLPKTFLGKIYYGLLFGCSVALFGRLGKVSGYPAFALLIANTMTERSDIFAEQTITGIKRFAIFAQTRLNFHEEIREKAETGLESANPLLTDTQEIIIIDRQDYDMPPIDNEIIKIKRKKPNLVQQVKEKLLSLSQKRKYKAASRHGAGNPADDSAAEEPSINMIENLIKGVKELKPVFKKREVVSEYDDEDSTLEEELDPLKLSILLDDDDVIEIEESANTKMRKAGKK